LLLAQLKGAPFETALRMATELGATHIQPVQAARSVARGDKRDRWGRVVASAVQQCGRTDPPDVRPPLGLAAALAALPAEVAVWWCDPGAPPGDPPGAGPAAVLVGPEGGWTPEETEIARAAGARALSLGRHVLRADTAVAAALARLG
jgi:16S rRNA (uracil1498-N3)-methyltransferase